MTDQAAKANRKLDAIEPTDEWLTSRAGLGLYQRYLENSGLLDRLDETFGYVRKIDKGLGVRYAFKQLLCFFAGGTGEHLVDLDRLTKDPGYAGILETTVQRMGSSHAFKRFLQSFPFVCFAQFRPLLRDLFVKRLNYNQPEAVVLFLDT